VAPILVAALFLLAASAAPAGAATGGSAALPTQLWAAELDARGLDRATLQRLRARGLNAVVLRRGTVSLAGLAQARTLVARAGLLPISPSSTGACKKACASRVRSARSTLRLLRVKGPQAVTALAASNPRGRILVLAPLAARHDARTWRSAIDAAIESPSIDLGISPAGGQNVPGRFLDLLKSERGKDRVPPTAPGDLAAREIGQVMLSLGWRPSGDN
jgi:hypothetical protein